MNILFLCTGNSCRSQMAEAWARKLAQDAGLSSSLAFKSAGLEVHGLNPLAVKVMQQQAIDISKLESTLLDDSLLNWADLVVTVCSHADQHCPLSADHQSKLHLPFEDPAAATGNEEQRMQVFRRVCEQIKSELSNLLKTLKPAH